MSDGKERLAAALARKGLAAGTSTSTQGAAGTTSAPQRQAGGPSDNQRGGATTRPPQVSLGGSSQQQDPGGPGVVRRGAGGSLIKGSQALLGGGPETLAQYPDATFDAILTDPGAGRSDELAGWERQVPNARTWQALLRVIKPGGHAAVFANRRHSHKLAWFAEEAGWEIRDTLMWVYPKGMPMSLDIGQAVDKKMGGEGTPWFRAIGAMTDEERARMGKANPWFGYGTELRPTWEPIILLRRPPEGSVATNVMKWDVGALNIDDTRIQGETREAIATYIPGGQGDAHGLALQKYQQVVGETSLGRWPADALFQHGEDCSPAGCRGDCAVAALEAQAEGTAKFFYCPKTSRRERDLGLPAKGNQHKSVKPLAVCEWLLRLILPPMGTVVDPWCGAGSTGMAAIRLDGTYLGLDADPHWLEIAATRMEALRRGDLD